MNRTTLIILGLFVVLLAVYLVVDRHGEEMPDLRIEVPAIRADGQPKDDEPEGAVGPPDRMEIIRKGVTMVLRRGNGDQWEVVEPVVTGARTYRVNAMLRVFQYGAESSLGRAVAADDLKDYGLGEDRRIQVRMMKGEEILVALWIGDSEKVNDDGTRDTNVMSPDGDAVFRVRGADLRKPFDLDPDEIQDKKIFRFKKDEVRRLVIEDPRDEARPRLVFEKGAGKDEWKLVEPGGYQVGGLGSYCSSLANLTAIRFAEKLPGAEAKALDRTYKVTITTGDGEEVRTLELGAGRGAVWARVSNRDGFFQVSTSAAKGLMKGLVDLRDKKLFDFAKEDVQRLELIERGANAVVLERDGDGWRFVSPADEAASSASVNRLASALAALRTQTYRDSAVEGAGLDNPQFVLKVTAGAAVRVLEIGNEKPQDDEKASKRFYARLDGAAEIMELADYSVKGLRKSVDDLRDERVFRIEADEITGVEIAYPDQTVSLKKQGGAWAVTAPERIDDPQGVNTIISTLANLPVKQEDTGKTPEEAQLSVTYTITTKDGKTRTLRLSEEVANGGNYAQAPGLSRLGDKVFTVNQYKAANLLKKLPDLKKK